MPEKEPIRNLNIIKYFLITFIVLFTVTFSILFFTEQQIRKIKFEELKSKEEHFADLEYEYIANDLDNVLTDLYFLRNAYVKELQNPDNYDEIAIDWAEFSTQQKIYDQIRFIDLEGNEKIRINYTDEGAYIVPYSELQNKKDRYYFTESIALNKYGVFMSPLDLNMEQGQIETPNKPIIRISVALFDDSKHVFGIIIMNYLAQDMLTDFQRIARNDIGEIVLVNSDGYWLSNVDESILYSFMFPDLPQNTFDSKYTSDWIKVINRENTQFVSPNGLFTSVRFNMVKQLSGDSNNLRTLYNSKINIDWYIVSILPRENQYNYLFYDRPMDILLNLILTNWLYIILIIIISCFVAGLLHINQKSFNTIKHFSEYDGLTNVYNRRAGLEKIRNQFSVREQRKYFASLCFIDINELKPVNDILGHKIGDDLIVTTVQIIKSAIRENDFIIRMGGDEFLIVLQSTTEIQAEEVWERICRLINDFNATKQKPYTISVSHGVIYISNSEEIDIDEAVRVADEKMYAEKQKLKVKQSE